MMMGMILELLNGNCGFYHIKMGVPPNLISRMEATKNCEVM
jgi:hypothetical protein